MSHIEETGPEPTARGVAGTSTWAVDPRSRAWGGGTHLSDGYARLYAPIAVFTLVLSFHPLFEHPGDTQAGRATAGAIGSTWDLLLEGHPEAALGLLLLFIVVGLLTAGAFGVRSIALAVGIASTCVLLVGMLLAKPGFRDPVPELTDMAQAGVAVGVGTTVLAVTHAVHLFVARARTHAGLRRS